MSKLTWIEEWLLNFQVFYGTVKTRWIDYEKSWKLNADSLGTILKGKVKMIKETRAIYLMDATYEEDKLFRVEQWDDNFSTEDVKFHDCTNINMPCPSDRALQSVCYRDSYGGKVGKCLVTNQPCGDPCGGTTDGQDGRHGHWQNSESVDPDETVRREGYEQAIIIGVDIECF